MTSASVIEELATAQCAELLETHHFGRIAVVVDGRPIIFPVNYVLDRDAVVFRTEPGTKLSGAALGRVSFEIDGVDEGSRTGWSVVVQGVGNDITDAVDLRSEGLRGLELQPWVPGERDRWVAIVSRSITGRRVRKVHATESG